GGERRMKPTILTIWSEVFPNRVESLAEIFHAYLVTAANDRTKKSDHIVRLAIGFGIGTRVTNWRTNGIVIVPHAWVANEGKVIAIRREKGGPRLTFRKRSEAIKCLKSMFGPEASMTPEEIRQDLRRRLD